MRLCWLGKELYNQPISGTNSNGGTQNLPVILMDGCLWTHKAVLASLSGFLRYLLLDLGEVADPVLVMPDVKVGDLACLLDCLAAPVEDVFSPRRKRNRKRKLARLRRAMVAVAGAIRPEHEVRIEVYYTFNINIMRN